MSLIEMDLGSVGEQPVGQVPLSALPVGHSWRVAGIDVARVRALGVVLAATPPIVVRRADRTVVDGAHRVAAARRLGLRTLPVVWFDGSLAEAFGAFASRNGVDGLPLSPEDRRNGVVLILGTEPTFSDRRIAHLCGVSPKMVARLRHEVGGDLPVVEAKRVGRDGRSRPLHPGLVRERIAAAIADDPAASLRAIAARLDVSPETVRSVRKDMSRSTPGPTTSPVEGAVADMTIERFLEMRRLQHVAPAPWRDDNAFRSTPTGTSFVEWFDATAIEAGLDRVDEVPLSRVYDIADDARRRARFWTEFAESLEARTRRLR